MSRTKAFFLTFLISMLPIVELRGSIPFAAAINTIPRITFIEALPVSIIGNMIPVPFIILLFKYFFKIFRDVKYIGPVFTKVHNKAIKHADKIQKYAYWGLFLFVAIPCPGTGAWTGAVIASVLEMRLRKAFPTILLGVITSGLIMGFISYGLLDLIKTLF
ncbi:MAG: small multi-drug export protein [Ruminococcaceae bacterium]|nr:small multi-drug export protein [Oscillospiraceae bacterium]